MSETAYDPRVVQERGGDPSKVPSALPSTPGVNGASLTSGRLLAKNVVWNLLGTVAPLLVAVPAVPRLIHAMGTDRFGVLTLAWLVIGYFSLFDLGLGRALTNLVAQKLGDGDRHEISSLVWNSLLIMLLLGCVGGIALAAVSPWLARSALRVPSAIQGETIQAFFVLSAALPVVIMSTGLRGVLEAYQDFRAVSALRALLGVLTFGSPLLVLPFSHSLVPTAGALAVSRLLVFIASLFLCLFLIPELREGFRIHLGSLPLLLRFGLWMTVSNVVSPLLVYVDRLVIGATVSVAAVAYYATPYEVVTKFLFLPAALAGVLFPAFSTSFIQDRSKASKLFERGAKFALLALFPVALVTVVLAREGLTLWLGPEFANHGAQVLQWLSAGVLMNGVALVPFTQVQAAGRSDLTAKLHLMELPLYLTLLWLLVGNFGIVGAAIAWTARVSLDCLLLFVVAARLLPESLPAIRKVFLGCVAALSVLAIGTVPETLPFKISFLLATSAILGMATWFFVLTPAEKAFMWTRERSSLASG